MSTTKTTVKTTSIKTATPKVTDEVEEKNNVPEKEIISKPKKYAKDELIECRSVTAGLLLYNGPKSNLPYSWSGYGDISYVEYQDLLAAMAVGSDYIFDPLFVIEDEELLKDSKWNSVKSLYESMIDVNDVKEILALPVVRFRKKLEQLPKGLLNALKAEVSSQIANGTFDSYQKVKIIDELCGTDFKVLMS